jgi:leucyl aminopeptidase
MIQVQHRGGSASKAKLGVHYSFFCAGDDLAARIESLAASASKALCGGDFSAKLGQVSMVYTGDERCPRAALVGVGPRADLSLERVRRATGALCDHLRSTEATTSAVSLDDLAPLDKSAAAAACAEAAVLAGYRYQGLKTEAGASGGRKLKATPTLRTLTVFSKARGAKAAIERAVASANAANACRALADEPGNIATPRFLTKEARRLGRKHGFKVRALSEKDMGALGMGSLLAVSKGSREPAQLIIMEHKPAGAKETVCLVGKGLTFDAGGISLKPSDRMWDMKYDKCGGCAVIGAMCAIADLGLPLHVVGLVPASENMPDGAAIKPGDIVRSLTGHSIEIQNTDAEGRLILADALGYSHRYKPSMVIDFATLTGACVVALGAIRAGVMGNDDALCQQLVAAGDRSGERVWQLPQDEEYGELLKTDGADLKNIGGRFGGAITAGFFLSHFVPPEARWAHVDIAGPAWKKDSSTKKTYLHGGATGFGTRLIVDFLSDYAGR